MSIQNLSMILLLLLSKATAAQQVSGSVLDWESKSPIFQVKISNGKESTITDLQGHFSLKTFSAQDTLRISKDGYSSKQLMPTNQPRTAQLVLFLLPLAHALKEVHIEGTARYKADSLKMRKDFSNVFKYKRPSVMDMFVSKSAESRISMFRNPNSNSTASIVSFNLLQLPGLFARNKTPNSKLKTALIQDEQRKFVDQSFSKSRVSEITSLNGDSLQSFMEQYRPSAERLKEMSTYELLLYIKKSSSEFKKSSKQQLSLPALK
jgi:hypothetical protein